MKMDVESMLVGLVESRQWPMVAAALIWLVVRALKSERIPLNVPARARPWVALGLGVVAGVCESVLGGVALGDALLAGLGAGLAASGLHESLVESLRHGREPLSIPPPALVDPPRESRRPPPGDGPSSGTGGVTITIMALALAGCGASGPIREVEALAHSARDVAQVAEVCAFNAKEAEMAKCHDDRCKAEVLARYAPLADMLDRLHSAWCTVSPESEGCK
jgi:hypothetical protein